MRGMVLATGFVAALVMAADAADQPVAGTKLVLKRSRQGREKLVFVSKDPGALFPALGGPDDPGTGTPGGMVVELFSTAEPAGAALAVPPGTDWTAQAGGTSAHRYRNRLAPGGPSAVRAVVLKQGRLLKVVARATGLALATAQGAVGIRVTTGALRNCALFAGAAIRQDAADVFSARNAPAGSLADCADTSLGGAAATTTTTMLPTTTTTMLAVCGNGVLDAGETCDPPAADESCPLELGVQCRPPGFGSASCQCCLDGGPGVQLFGCCNPSSVLIPAPNTSGTCVPTRCDPPFTCGAPNGCLPDGSCCTGAGGTALYTLLGYPIFLNPCCEGLAVTPTFYGVGCCRPTGSCATDGECCTGHCVAGSCEACRAAGTGCATDAECCSLSCTAGTCDACAPVGAPCSGPASCCSGSCLFDGTTLTCAAAP